MKIALVSRYPQADTPAWKRELAERLCTEGHELAVLFSSSSLRDIARAGFAEYGFDAMRRFLSRSPAEAGVAPHVAGPRTLDAWANSRGLLRHYGVRLDDPQTLDWTRALAPDLLILVGADIAPQTLLEIPRLGSLNAHYGLLPRYRGMNVTEWSIYHDDPVGVTVHAVDPGIDTGPIHLRRSIAVQPGATLESIRADQRALSARLLGDAVARLTIGTAEPVAQASDQGRQFYRMHPLLLQRVRTHLSAGYRWLGVPDPPATITP